MLQGVFSYRYSMKKIFIGLSCALAFVPLFCACSPKIDYYSHASEIRSDIFRAEAEDFTLTVSCISREYPYVSDGIAAPKTNLLEISLATDLREEFSVYLIGDTKIGGETSFRNTRGDYFYSEGVKQFPDTAVTVRVEWKDGSREFTATSVKNERTLTPKEALNKALSNEKETLAGMTKNGQFEGEFYVRLLRRDKNYYYVGIVSKDAGVISLLLDGESGEVLARRES